MARSNGPCHSLTIKLGHMTKARDLLQDQLSSLRDAILKRETTLKNAHIEALRQLKETYDSNVGPLKESVAKLTDDRDRLADLVVAFARLSTARRLDGEAMSDACRSSLNMLQSSLEEAAIGLGVQFKP